MKATLYITKRVRFQWPNFYVLELVEKLNDRGFKVSVISDDTEEGIAKREIESSDLYVGVPNKFDKYGGKGKRIRLLGATKEGEGVVSSVQCAGCVENIKDSIDCLWEDSLCMYEITPNDVLEAACL